MTERFFHQQLRVWPMAAANYRALDTVARKNFNLGQGLNIEVQCIPQRLRSVAAKTGAAALAARPCFLCTPQLPAEQISLNLLYADNQIQSCEQAQEDGYRLLVNPFPVFKQHFTIAALRHRPQSLSKDLPVILALAAAMPSYLLFYNAPGAGASAPDHLHFQAAPKASMPLDRDFASWHAAHSRLLFRTAESKVYTQADFLRTAWLLQGSDSEDLCLLLQELLQLIALHSGSATQEPRVNLLCWYQEGSWFCMLFARSQHRPTCYYESGERQIMVSPGSVEMGGLIILARQEDFDKLHPELISRIYAEVTWSTEDYDILSQTWKNRHQA